MNHLTLVLAVVGSAALLFVLARLLLAGYRFALRRGVEQGKRLGVQDAREHCARVQRQEQEARAEARAHMQDRLRAQLRRAQAHVRRHLHELNGQAERGWLCEALGGVLRYSSQEPLLAELQALSRAIDLLLRDGQVTDLQVFQVMQWSEEVTWKRMHQWQPTCFELTRLEALCGLALDRWNELVWWWQTPKETAIPLLLDWQDACTQRYQQLRTESWEMLRQGSGPRAVTESLDLYRQALSQWASGEALSQLLRAAGEQRQPDLERCCYGFALATQRRIVEDLCMLQAARFLTVR